MMQADHEKLMVEMCKKWPNKFTDSDLEYWCRELKSYDVSAILECLTEHKGSSKYVPKLPEIRHKLAGKGGAVTHRSLAYRTPTARAVIATNPQMRGRPEADLILRNARWLLRYRGRSDTGEVQFFDDVCMVPADEYDCWVHRKNAKLGASEGDDANGIREEMMAARVMHTRLPLLRAACIGDLITAGWESGPAENAADWITAPSHEFKGWCADANVVREECPV